MSLSVPLTLIHALQASFEAESKRVARDVAKVLRVSEKEVLQIVKQMPKVSLKACDDSEYPSSCPVLLQDSQIVKRCRLPCILGTGLCLEHQKQKVQDLELFERSIKLTKIKINSELENQSEYWFNEETKEVFNQEGNIVGTIRDDRLELYVFEE
jgi:hypothetical protein